MQPYYINFPSHYDAQYIVQRLTAELGNAHYGYDTIPETGELRFGVRPDRADVLLAIEADYQTAYLSVALPKLKQQVKDKRTQRRMDFTFGGTPIPLDEIAMGRIGNMAVGLDLCPEVDEIYWDKGVLDFEYLPREVAIPLAKAAFKFVQADFTFSKNLGVALDAAETVDAALAIVNDAEWPA